jgi:hypothetical protein
MTALRWLFTRRHPLADLLAAGGIGLGAGWLLWPRGGK